MESVEKYHGFYIARYESSSTIATISTQDKISVGKCIWGANSEGFPGSGAVEASREVYPASNANTGGVVSTLCYGVQWDQTVRFLEKNYPGISQNSAKYGNYSADEYIKTGSNENYKQNNIYDMCGNRLEWTMEADNQFDARILRGAGYNLSVGCITYDSIAARYPLNPTINDSLVYYSGMGFRIALYIK